MTLPAIRRHGVLFLLTGILLLSAASRLIYFTVLPVNWDEVWSAWQTLGSAADTIRWTPTDWPPLFFLLLWAWKSIVGIRPEVLRMLSVLLSLIGIACFYRVSRRLWNERVAVLATLAYAAVAYDIFLSVLIRGYIPVLALTPLALWLTIRYFDHPSLRRAIVLALSLLAMYFSHYTSIFIFLLIGLCTIFIYRRKIWRWWLPMLFVAPFILYDVLSKRDLFLTRTGYNATLALPPLPTALYNAFSALLGPPLIVWMVLFVAATALIILRRRLTWKALAMLAWVVALALPYFFQRNIGLFQDYRYLWWVLPGFAWWIGLGLSYLPRRGAYVAAIGLAVLMFWPGLLDKFQGIVYRTDVPLYDNLKTLKELLRPGDVVTVDKNNICGPIEAWDYFQKVEFPTGLPYVSDPKGYRRVWYITTNWLSDPATVKAVETNRVPGKFFGLPTCLFRLYEGAPNEAGVLFENGLRFHGAELSGVPTAQGLVFHEGESIHIRLWWSIDRPITADYSIGLYAMTPMGLAQDDGPPHVPDESPQTSHWVTGRYYVEERDLRLPYPLDEGRFTVYLSVYQWWDNHRITAPGVDEHTLLPLQTIDVHAW